MDEEKIQSALDAYRTGDIDLQEASARIRALSVEPLGHSHLDHQREARVGVPEIIFGEGKTAAQITDIMTSMKAHGSNILATRIEAAKADEILTTFKEATYHEAARCLTLTLKAPKTAGGTIAIVSAGTSDFAVAEEARVTASFLGNPIECVSDVGVAGIHRLFSQLPTLRRAKVVIVIAGMEGALPSVVGGLVPAPVIAVPTSVGYGASFGGLAALLGMLSSCASGVSVVNIDNGFGAAYSASLINHL